MKDQMTTPLLSVGLLVSNRKDTVPKTLQSLERLRREIACELIVTDTGCDADLAAMLKETADVYTTFSWIGDFAAARNANLSCARGMWYMYLDDDEWFTDTAALVHFFQCGDYENYDSVSYIQRNYEDMAGSRYTDIWVNRMFLRTEERHFVGKIHEYYKPKAQTHLAIPVVAEHYGYVFAGEADRQRHFMRNASLLAEMMEEEPDNLRWPMQMTMEYYATKQYEELVGLCGEFAGTLSEKAKAEDIVSYQGILAAQIAGFLGAIKQSAARGDIDHAVMWNMQMEEVCARAEKEEGTFETLLVYIAYARAEAAFVLYGLIGEEALPDGRRILEDYDRYEKALAASKSTEEASRYFIMLTPPFCAEVFSERMQYIMATHAFMAMLLSDVHEGCVETFGKMGWEKPAVYIHAQVMDILAEALSDPGRRYVREGQVFFEALYDHFLLWNRFGAACEIVADEERSKALAASAGETSFKRSMEDSLRFWRAVRKMTAAGDPGAGELAESDGGPDFATLRGIVAEYADAGKVYVEHYLDTMLKGSHLSTVPVDELAKTCESWPYFVAAKACGEGLALLEDGHRDALEKWKEVAMAIPEFADLMKVMIRESGDYLTSHSSELALLKMKKEVMANVESLMMAGQLDEAEEILLQLKEMLPGDAEIEEGLGMLAQMRGL